MTRRPPQTPVDASNPEALKEFNKKAFEAAQIEAARSEGIRAQQIKQMWREQAEANVKKEEGDNSFDNDTTDAVQLFAAGDQGLIFDLAKLFEALNLEVAHTAAEINQVVQNAVNNGQLNAAQGRTINVAVNAALQPAVQQFAQAQLMPRAPAFAPAPMPAPSAPDLEDEERALLRERHDAVAQNNQSKEALLQLLFGQNFVASSRIQGLSSTDRNLAANFIRRNPQTTTLITALAQQVAIAISKTNASIALFQQVNQSSSLPFNIQDLIKNSLVCQPGRNASAKQKDQRDTEEASIFMGFGSKAK
jgi:hypothetical protein